MVWCFIMMCSGSLFANESSQGSLRLFNVDYLGDLPTMVAVEQNSFRRHGLDIEVNRSATGKQTLQALRAGEADFALMGITPLVLNLLKDPLTGTANDPMIIASMAYSNNLNQVVTLEGNGIIAPLDLPGRRVGLMAGTKSEYLWWMFTILHRIDPATTTVVDMPIATLAEALIAGEIDAALLWEPWTSRLRSRLGSAVVLLPGADIFIEKWILVTTRGLLQQRPDAIRDVLAAYQDAIAFIEASPGEALDIYTESAGLESQIAVAVEDLPLFGLSLDWSLLTALMETSDWARESARAGSGKTPNPFSWIESAPLRDVMPLSVRIPAHPSHEPTTNP